MKSMTGFGRFEASDERYRVTVEMKSVNHRYLDFSLRMPRKYNAFEPKIRSLVKSRVERGKVDLYLSEEALAADTVALKYNSALAAEYLRCLNEMQEEFGLRNEVTLYELSRYPEIFSMEQPAEDEETLWQLVSRAISGALDDFTAHREEEGANLCADLREKLAAMSSEVDAIEVRAPKILAEYEQKLTARIQELLGDQQPDENRVLTEVAIMADKLCTDEEIVRLKSHIAAMDKLLSGGESGGRKLDFIAQEMNREANTILSKASDMEVTERAIHLKTEIEKIREQVQNIE